MICLLVFGLKKKLMKMYKFIKIEFPITRKNKTKDLKNTAKIHINPVAI